ncbi:MAG: YgiQ family radical SAM protein [Deltaproteobacteria bacterium HGW-Deltaproteobacteria-10]|nr:MAG: YgiQ family radical SAM protein [Deltaproteobacteria bacterium HGW-Deltaproteobacteria-10]
MFLPTTRTELKKLKWDKLDIILVTGDTYIDSPFIGVAVIGRVLLAAGFRVGIIAQPERHNADDISRLGEPELFWGITGGCMDSMVANYTATKKKRHGDDLTAGGKNNRRPDRACVVYANLIRQHFKNTRPLVLGGVEASLRRIAHYDYWSDSIRRSLLLDTRADFLVYGMAEKAILELAQSLQKGRDTKDIRGICYIDSQKHADYLELPSFEELQADKKAFTAMFNLFYRNNDPLTARGMIQQHGPRFLIHNPPQLSLTTGELDKIYALEYERDVHPFYAVSGSVKALDTIKFSITSHRGCFGECNFCSIGIHEGRTIIARSENSIIAEVRKLAALPDFKGYILDVGGATANMYGIDCTRKQTKGACSNKRCLYPRVCNSLNTDHSRQINLLRQLRKIEGVKKVFVASGIRYDLLLADKKHCLTYMQELVRHHISGQLKVAPEHTGNNVLKIMGKPGVEDLLAFKAIFEKLNAAAGSKQFLTYYFIAAHPGCAEEDMRDLKAFTSRELKINPQQVQIFTPTPSTYSSLMYWTQIDPATGKKIFVEKDANKKQKQKDIVAAQAVENKASYKRIHR